jgi:hypothetical protein
VIVQSFASAPRKAFWMFQRGLQTQDAAKTWRRSRNDGPHNESRSNGLGMLLMSPVVFSGWFVRFLDREYEAENE